MLHICIEIEIAKRTRRLDDEIHSTSTFSTWQVYISTYDVIIKARTNDSTLWSFDDWSAVICCPLQLKMTRSASLTSHCSLVGRFLTMNEFRGLWRNFGSDSIYRWWVLIKISTTRAYQHLIVATSHLHCIKSTAPLVETSPSLQPPPISIIDNLFHVL